MKETGKEDGRKERQRIFGPYLPKHTGIAHKAAFSH